MSTEKKTAPKYNGCPTGLYEHDGKIVAVRVDVLDVEGERLSTSGKNYTLATGKLEIGKLTIGGVLKQVISIGTTYRWK